MVVRIGQRSARPRKTFFREWREFRALTQEQLADLLDTTKSSVSKLENGHVLFNQSSLYAWAEALRCEPADLLYRNPLDGETPWALLDSLRPEDRSRAVEFMRNLKGTEG